VTILENERIALDTYRIRLEDPELARVITPGQFVMIRPSSGFDPLLGRPFALYEVVRDASGAPVAVDLVYLVVGRGTSCLSERRAGERVTIWGPLGNGFGPPPPGDVIFVAGGIGQTPFVSLGRWWTNAARYGEGAEGFEKPARSVRLLYGVRSAAYAAGLLDFQVAGIPVELATDDGSLGHQGYVTDLLLRHLDAGRRPVKVVGCGPTPMLKSLCAILERHGIEGDLSLENHMACGFGACFSCVTPIRQPDGTTDLRRVCVEGPIFPASKVVWA
jgi:dihydroorotate dehydrogenase electron transfer subunit